MLKAYGIGNITHNLKIKDTKKGKLCILQIACNQEKKTTFANVHIKGNLCNSLAFAGKGRRIAVQGDLKIKKISSKAGPIFYTYIDCKALELL